MYNNRAPSSDQNSFEFITICGFAWFISKIIRGEIAVLRDLISTPCKSALEISIIEKYKCNIRKRWKWRRSAQKRKAFNTIDIEELLKF